MMCLRYGCPDVAAGCIMLPACRTPSRLAQFFRGQTRESATQSGLSAFRAQRGYSKAICILRIISNEMNGNRLDDRSGKFQHQRDGLGTSGKHLVRNAELVHARQQFVVDFNKASGSMFTELSFDKRYPPHLSFSFANVGGAGVRSL